MLDPACVADCVKAIQSHGMASSSGSLESHVRIPLMLFDSGPYCLSYFYMFLSSFSSTDSNKSFEHPQLHIAAPENCSHPYEQQSVRR